MQILRGAVLSSYQHSPPNPLLRSFSLSHSSSLVVSLQNFPKFVKSLSITAMPPSSSSAFSGFPPGTKVEARFNEVSFQGAWFEATVVKYARTKRRYTVALDSLVTEDNPPKPVKETVFYTSVRPRPPGGGRSLFKLHQLVEAYHNDGWWKGVVIEVPRGADRLYTVRFPLSKEEFQFEGEMMREQLEWVKEKWVPVDDNDQEENMMFGVGSQVEVSRDTENYGTAWFVGTVLKVIGKSYVLVEYQSLTVGDDRNRRLLKEIVDLEYIRPSPSSSPKFHSFNVLDEVEAFHRNGWLVGVVASILPGSRYVIKSKHQDEEIELDKDFLRPHFDWTMKHWECITQKRGKKAPVSSAKKQAGQEMKFHAVERSQCPPSVLTCDSDDVVVVDCDAVNLEANKSEGHRVGNKVEASQPRRKSKNVPCSSTIRNDDEVADKSGVKNLKNKKAREPHVEDVANSSQPHKKSKKGIQQEDLQKPDGTLKDNAPTRMRRKKCVSRWSYMTRKTSDVIETMETTRINLSGNIVELANTSILSTLPSKEARTDPTPSTTEVVVSEAHKIPSDPAPSGASPPGKHVRYPSPKDNVVDDQNNFIPSLLLSEEPPPDPTPSIAQKVFSEANKNPVVAAPTGLSPSEEHVTDHNELVPSTHSTGNALTETDMVPTGLFSNKITLPFAKRSAMWKTFESMEVFRTMPQQPHFQELNNFNMEIREGMAVGLMLTFANLVDGTAKLQITDSQEVIERKLEPLASLESNGFNVSGMRSLLEKLLLLKCNASQHAAKQVLMEGRIKEKDNELHQLDLSLGQQNEVKSELEISMRRCHEKISCTLTEKNTKESKVSKLRLDLQNAGEAYLSCAMQFKSLLNDPW